MKTITVTMKFREQNFGRLQPKNITHIAITAIPTSKNKSTFLPITHREAHSYWSDRDAGISGYYWSFTADMPEEFADKSIWDASVGEYGDGDFVAFLAEYNSDAYIVYE